MKLRRIFPTCYNIDFLDFQNSKQIWKILAGDFYQDVSEEKCVENIKKYLLWNAHSPEEKEYIKNFKA